MQHQASPATRVSCSTEADASFLQLAETSSVWPGFSMACGEMWSGSFLSSAIMLLMCVMRWKGVYRASGHASEVEQALGLTAWDYNGLLGIK